MVGGHARVRGCVCVRTYEYVTRGGGGVCVCVCEGGLMPAGVASSHWTKEPGLRWRGRGTALRWLCSTIDETMRCVYVDYDHQRAAWPGGAGVAAHVAAEGEGGAVDGAVDGAGGEAAAAASPPDANALFRCTAYFEVGCEA